MASKDPILAPKQTEFIRNSTRDFNLAWGSMRSGKTVATLYRFMQAIYQNPDSAIWMIGHTASTIYDNVVALIINKPRDGEPDPLGIYRPFCTWLESKRELVAWDKTINTIGAKDRSAAGIIQGKTMSLCYCDEMTLFDPVIIDTIFTRLSSSRAKLFASLNPTYPAHKLKQWIDLAEAKDPSFYALHFTVDDNPFLTDKYKANLRKTLSGVFYKRNYLGLWCLAEGAIFDFFERSRHVVARAPRAAEYFLAGIDYGTKNAFACVIVGYSSGQFEDAGYKYWVEKEYYWDCIKRGHQKTPGEFARDMQSFLEPYAPRSIYLDPSSAFFKLELQRLNLHVAKTDNDVDTGILSLMKELGDGNLVIMDTCHNLIREVEGYVWDPKTAERGYDEPLKKDDHAIDALRYVIATHKPSKYNADEERRRMQRESMQQPLHSFDPRTFRR
jgi:PBSX family phage terminase large subunit